MPCAATTVRVHGCTEDYIVMNMILMIRAHIVYFVVFFFLFWMRKIKRRCTYNSALTVCAHLTHYCGILECHVSIIFTSIMRNVSILRKIKWTSTFNNVRHFFFLFSLFRSTRIKWFICKCNTWVLASLAI